MNLIINASSEPRLQQYKKSLPQALLITGMPGVGLYTAASALASVHGDVFTVKPDLLTKTSTVPQISIGAVRELYEQTRTHSKQGRVIIIDDADKMTQPAQNAFLKLLEEPNSSTRFILTSHRPELLLPTIRSRLESWHLPLVSKEQTLAVIESSTTKLTQQKKAQLLFIAEGLPAELNRMLADEQSFRQKASLITTARAVIEGNAYQRTVAISKEKLTRQSADQLIEQLTNLLTRNPSPSGLGRVERLLAARERIAGGGNVKLQLLVAML